VREEIDKLMAQPMSENDLSIAKNTIKSSIRLGSDSMENRMFSLAKGEMFYDGPLSDDEICEQIDQVRSADIWRVAKDIFGRERWCIVTLGKANKAKLVKALIKKKRK
jgi:predicted Zn-dependent peptidase